MWSMHKELTGLSMNCIYGVRTPQIVSGMPVMVLRHKGSLTASSTLPPDATPSPEQVGTLGSLRSLTLKDLNCSASGYSALAGLTSLTSLELLHCAAIPSSLSQLTTLEHCHLTSTPSAAVFFEGQDFMPVIDSLDVALAPLMRLTYLEFLHRTYFSTLRFDRLPTALASLRQLRQLKLIIEPAPAITSASLAAGPWLSGIQVLVLPAAVVVLNLALLDTASKLECLVPTECLDGMMDGSDMMKPIRTILAWAARHVSLRSVLLNCSSSLPLPAELCDALLDAVRRKPTLCIRHIDNPWLLIEAQVLGCWPELQ